jgi:hypothetical protein
MFIKTTNSFKVFIQIIIFINKFIIQNYEISEITGIVFAIVKKKFEFLL